MCLFLFVLSWYISFNVCSDGDRVNDYVYMRSSIPVVVFVENPAYLFVHINIIIINLVSET